MSKCAEEFIKILSERSTIVFEVKVGTIYFKIIKNW